MTARIFDLGDVLSVTTGHLVTGIRDNFRVMKFLLGDDRVAAGHMENLATIKAALRPVLPTHYDNDMRVELADLASRVMWASLDEQADIYADWVAKQKQRLGDTVELVPLSEMGGAS